MHEKQTSNGLYPSWAAGLFLLLSFGCESSAELGQASEAEDFDVSANELDTEGESTGASAAEPSSVGSQALSAEVRPSEVDLSTKVTVLTAYEYEDFEGQAKFEIKMELRHIDIDHDVQKSWSYEVKSFVLAPGCAASFAKNRDEYLAGNSRWYNSPYVPYYNSKPSHLKNDGYVNVRCSGSGSGSDGGMGAVAKLSATSNPNLHELMLYGKSYSAHPQAFEYNLPSAWQEEQVDLLLYGRAYPGWYVYIKDGIGNYTYAAKQLSEGDHGFDIPYYIAEDMRGVALRPESEGCLAPNTCWANQECTGQYIVSAEEHECNGFKRWCNSNNQCVSASEG